MLTNYSKLFNVLSCSFAQTVSILFEFRVYGCDFHFLLIHDKTKVSFSFFNHSLSIGVISTGWNRGNKDKIVIDSDLKN